jgi:predicted transcriptional regulator
VNVKTTGVSIRITQGEKLRAVALVNDRSVSWLINEAIEMYLTALEVGKTVHHGVKNAKAGE